MVKDKQKNTFLHILCYYITTMVEKFVTVTQTKISRRIVDFLMAQCSSLMSTWTSCIKLVLSMKNEINCNLIKPCIKHYILLLNLTNIEFYISFVKS